MPIGAGKYDELCTYVREQTNANTVLLIILGGKLGQGFSCQSIDPIELLLLPGILRTVADEIERSRIEAIGR